MKISASVLEDAKFKAASLALERPLPQSRALFPEPRSADGGFTSEITKGLSIMKRPKWNYEMSKKQVESNEAALFKKWLEFEGGKRGMRGAS